MSPEEIKDVVEQIRPKKVFPIHTEQPEMMKKLYKKTVMVKEGKGLHI
jgi:mRNA degradation ribonuclease J1/J2